ncbi:MAG: hypothetical protein JNK63_10835 [Chthonomonas sp.]|nr:hypothetical protein [Chthonomonas sp.]
MSVFVPCPAKINTFLSVGPPGVGGYHPIRTYLQAISLCDLLFVEVSDENHIDCDIALPDSNTLSNTLRLLRDLVELPPLRVTLKKIIPSEAGLGGGSSDAAGLIRGISFLTGLPIDQHVLDVASAVGKDVPFFLMGGRAIGEGLGDKLTPLDDEEPSWIVVGKPIVGVSTKSAYHALDENERPFEELPTNFWTGHNDFAMIAPRPCRDLEDRLKGLGAQSAGLSGSGSAVWGRFLDANLAIEARRQLAQLTWAEGFIAATCTRAQSLELQERP